MKLNSGQNFFWMRPSRSRCWHHIVTCATLFIIGLLIRIICLRSALRSPPPSILTKPITPLAENKIKRKSNLDSTTIYLFDFDATPAPFWPPGTLDYPLSYAFRATHTQSVYLAIIFRYGARRQRGRPGTIDYHNLVFVWKMSNDIFRHRRPHTHPHTEYVRDTISNFCTTHTCGGYKHCIVYVRTATNLRHRNIQKKNTSRMSLKVFVKDIFRIQKMFGGGGNALKFITHRLLIFMCRAIDATGIQEYTGCTTFSWYQDINKNKISNTKTVFKL